MMTLIMPFVWAVNHFYLVFTYYEIIFLNIQGDPGKAGEAGSPGASGKRVSAVMVQHCHGNRKTYCNFSQQAIINVILYLRKCFCGSISDGLSVLWFKSQVNLYDLIWWLWFLQGANGKDGEEGPAGTTGPLVSLPMNNLCQIYGYLHI